MNIEDIPDPELKTTFEKLLSVLGPPQYNN
jgi:hypothetical protein